MALTATEEKELKKLETINSPVPSQKKRILKLKKLKNIKRTEPPTGPKIVAITDKYPSGKFGSPSTKKPVTLPNRQGKRTPTEQARIDKNNAIVPNLKKMKLNKKADKKPIINNTTGSVSLPKKRLKQPTVSKVIKKPIINNTTGSVSLPKKRLKQPPVLKSEVSKTSTVNPNSKTGQYKAPKPKEESTFSSLLKFLRNKFSPSESISTTKIKKALPEGTSKEEIKSLKKALSYKERKPPGKDMPKNKVLSQVRLLPKKGVATKKVPNYTPKGSKDMLKKGNKATSSSTSNVFGSNLIPKPKIKPKIESKQPAKNSVDGDRGSLKKPYSSLANNKAFKSYIKQNDFNIKGQNDNAIEKGLAKIGGGRTRTNLESGLDSFSNHLRSIEDRGVDDLTSDELSFKKGMETKRKLGGKVKRNMGGKVKRNMGGKVAPRKKTVYRRGGGKALRGFGKATYSNKMY